mmetsp:Transcript_5917/g.10252  ORF Transcript_5917/g.10252 Transcript_5917/m.10252 type:complete len:295 (+) Transcript_5917:131-1015(+)
MEHTAFPHSFKQSSGSELREWNVCFVDSEDDLCREFVDDTPATHSLRVERAELSQATSTSSFLNSQEGSSTLLFVKANSLNALEVISLLSCVRNKTKKVFVAVYTDVADVFFEVLLAQHGVLRVVHTYADSRQTTLQLWAVLLQLVQQHIASKPTPPEALLAETHTPVKIVMADRSPTTTTAEGERTLPKRAKGFESMLIGIRNMAKFGLRNKGARRGSDADAEKIGHTVDDLNLPSSLEGVIDENDCSQNLEQLREDSARLKYIKCASASRLVSQVREDSANIEAYKHFDFSR